MDLLTKWLKEYKMVDQIHQVLGIEQFLTLLPVEKRVWLVERKSKTRLQAGEWFDEEAKRQAAQAEGQCSSKGSQQWGQGCWRKRNPNVSKKGHSANYPDVTVFIRWAMWRASARRVRPRFMEGESKAAQGKGRTLIFSQSRLHGW